MGTVRLAESDGGRSDRDRELDGGDLGVGKLGRGCGGGRGKGRRPGVGRPFGGKRESPEGWRAGERVRNGTDAFASNPRALATQDCILESHSEFKLRVSVVNS